MDKLREALASSRVTHVLEHFGMGGDIDVRSTLVIALTEAMLTLITTRYAECDPASPLHFNTILFDLLCESRIFIFQMLWIKPDRLDFITDFSTNI